MSKISATAINLGCIYTTSPTGLDEKGVPVVNIYEALNKMKDLLLFSFGSCMSFEERANVVSDLGLYLGGVQMELGKKNPRHVGGDLAAYAFADISANLTTRLPHAESWSAVGWTASYRVHIEQR